MKKTWMTVLLVLAAVMSSTVLAQQSPHWKQAEMARLQRDYPWVLPWLDQNAAFAQSELEFDVQYAALIMSGYGPLNMICIAGCSVKEFFGSMLTYPLKDGSRPEPTKITKNGNVYRFSFRLMGSPLDVYISNYPNAAHQGKISTVEQIKFRDQELDKADLMALMDSLADQYAIEQRTEEAARFEDSQRKAQQEEVEQKKRDAEAAKAEQRAAVLSNMADLAKKDPCKAKELELLQRLNIDVDSPMPKCGVVPVPKYPSSADGFEGTATVVVEVDGNGTVINIRVEKSSRNRELDRSAMDAARAIQFEPGMPGKFRKSYDFHFQQSKSWLDKLLK